MTLGNSPSAIDDIEVGIVVPQETALRNWVTRSLLWKVGSWTTHIHNTYCSSWAPEWMMEYVKLSLLGSWMALFVLFAGRKFTQPIKDDIGDKSVFIFQSLPEDEKKALVKKLEQ
ncbi:hypothetical protein ACLB2K_066931 [Fragaria x ananassa]